MRKVIATSQSDAASITWKLGARRALAICIAAGMLNLCSAVGLAYPSPDSAVPTGMTTVRGVVTIDGISATSGQTLFSGSSIATGQRSESTLHLGNLTRLNLYAESSLTLEFSPANVSGSLQKGSLRGFLPGGVPAEIVTADASISTDSGQPVAFSIKVESYGTTIAVETGRVEIASGNGLRSVAAGESFSTAIGGPPPPSQNLSDNKRIWLLLGIGGAVAVIVLAVTGRDNESACQAVVSGIGGPTICD